jgi:hypothetical protein
VTALGLSTLLFGGAYAALGGGLIIGGVNWFMHPPSKEPMVRVITLGGIVPALIIVLGGAFLLPAFLGLLAGWGVLLRKQWGRILAFIVAVVAILLGLLWVSGSDPDANAIAIGAAQLLYSILAFVILIVKGAEFSRSRV